MVDLSRFACDQLYQLEAKLNYEFVYFKYSPMTFKVGNSGQCIRFSRLTAVS